MRNPQRARYLANFLAPVLQNAGDSTAEPGSPDGCSCHETVAGSAEPAVDFAVGLELGMLLTPYASVFNIPLTARFVIVTVLAHAIFGVGLGGSVRWLARSRLALQPA